MSEQSETRGHALAEEINDTLNAEFDDTADYRDAVEAALSFFETVLSGLKADAHE